MSWNPPVRYPNSLEQNDPEGALNTYVIDNITNLDTRVVDLDTRVGDLEGAPAPQVDVDYALAFSSFDLYSSSAPTVFFSQTPDGKITWWPEDYRDASLISYSSGNFTFLETARYSFTFSVTVQNRESNTALALETLWVYLTDDSFSTYAEAFDQCGINPDYTYATATLNTVLSMTQNDVLSFHAKAFGQYYGNNLRWDSTSLKIEKVA